MGPSTAWRSTGPSSRLASAAVVVVLHVVLGAALLQFESVRTAVTAAAPVMATLISPPLEKPKVLPKPLPPPPKPKPQVQRKPRPAPQPPVITAQPEAPSTYTAPPPPPMPDPLPPIEEPVAVAPVVASAPPAPMIPPRFNAAYLNNPPPAYPLESRQMGEEGRVVLRVFVNEAGVPQEIQVRTSSGFGRLDTTAQETVRRWKFVPARRGDSAVGAWVLVPMTFKLRN
jgi:periplasmic protein TonB